MNAVGRRLAVVALLVAASIGCAGAEPSSPATGAEPASAPSTTTITTPMTTRATLSTGTSAAPATTAARRPRRVALFGDSMLEFGLPLYRDALTRVGHDVVAEAAQAGARLSDAYGGRVWARPRPDEVLARRPDVLLVSFGINDAAGPYEVTRPLIDRVLADARRAGVSCVVWQTWRSPATFFGDAAMGERLRRTWGDLRTLDRERADLVLNDLGAQLDAGATGLLDTDGIHLSADGTIANAVALIDAIDRCPAG